MKFFPLFLIFLSTSLVYAEVLIKPDNADINYYGRFDLSNSSTIAKFNWPGSIIEACFPGPSIGVELNDGGGSYFNVEIDGVLVDSIKPSTTTHRTIRTNLSNDNHIVRIILRTNGLNCSFGGFYLADGKALAAKPAQPTRKIEFIGDSWTAGDVTLQKTTPSDLKYFNAALTFARLTSKAYHAQDKLIARGGCGMVKSNGSDATMPVRYLKTLCDGSTEWDFTSWVPDLVVIFLGINDFNNGVTDANFKTAYTSFINTVRGRYKDAPIILIGLSGNILNDVQSVAQSFSKVYTFSSPITLANASALWQHPTPQQHHQIADALIPVVKQATGWDTATTVGISVPDQRHETHHSAGINLNIIKASHDKIVYPSNLSGTIKEIIVNDFAGRQLMKRITRNNAVSLSKDFGLPDGMYIIKTMINTKVSRKCLEEQ